MRVFFTIAPLIFLSTQFSFGQDHPGFSKPLKSTECLKSNDVRVVLKKDTSLVYLVNSSDSTINYYGLNGQPYLTKMVKLKNGKWKAFDTFIGCGTGLGNSNLEACRYSYTYTHFKSNFRPERQYLDTFHTSLKFCLEIDSVDICTKEINVAIEKYRILPYRYLAYKREEWLELLGWQSSTFYRNELMEEKINLIYKYYGF